MAEKALYSVVTGDAGVSAIIGTRMYPNIAPQGATMPYVVYRMITEFDRSRGISLDRGGLVARLFQFDLFGATYGAVKALADAIRLAIDTTAQTAAGQTWQLATVESQLDDWEFNLPGRETGVHRTTMDVQVWFEESTS
jgi:hypothetical protein